MIQLAAIAIGGSLGALFRYLALTLFGQWFGSEFPFGTLFVNIIGSFFLGVVYTYFQIKIPIDASLQVALQVGLLGAFTTFSTFSLDALLLIQRGDLLKAVAYISLSVIICIFAVYIGMLVARQWFA